MVQLYPLEEPEDVAEVQEMLRKFATYTGSERPTRILENWADYRPKFVKVYPNDYRRVIETQKRFKESGLSDEEAVMAAFEENAHDLARVGGK
jgi:glutamate synthase (ferredoxin)